MGIPSKFKGDRQPNPPRSSPAVESQPGRYPWGWFDEFCLRYPPGWLILFNRHWQHYQPDPQGWIGLDYALFLIPGGFYLALLLRWLRLGCQAPAIAAAPLNPGYQQAFRQEILWPILQRHFRAELHHLENLPSQGPVVMVVNHAGMCFPWDLIGLGVLLGHHRPWLTQPVAHPIFFDHAWMRWWLPAGWSQVLGGVPAIAASVEQAAQTLQPQQALLYAPEGWRGLAKGWPHRYQLQTFDPSVIQLSDRHHLPILPVACVGNELLHPWAFNIKPLARWFKLPMFPLSPLLLLFIAFPSMGVWAWRTRLQYYLQPVEWVEDDPPATLNRSDAYRLAQELRSRLQLVIERFAKIKCRFSGRQDIHAH